MKEVKRIYSKEGFYAFLDAEKAEKMEKEEIIKELKLIYTRRCGCPRDCCGCLHQVLYSYKTIIIKNKDVTRVIAYISCFIQ
jgi:hypothetical protein